jgi:hypothetical protein
VPKQRIYLIFLAAISSSLPRALLAGEARGTFVVSATVVEAGAAVIQPTGSVVAGAATPTRVSRTTRPVRQAAGIDVVDVTVSF